MCMLNERMLHLFFFLSSIYSIGLEVGETQSREGSTGGLLLELFVGFRIEFI